MEKLQIYLSFIAAVVISVVSIVQQVTLINMVSRLVIIIILFYIIGLFTKLYLNSKVFPKAEALVNEENVPAELELDKTNLNNLDLEVQDYEKQD